jgi:multidrug efflux pump subunit AcrA (membrane-fusion protein)
LEVKVRIYEPDEKLRPEMLCRGEFLGKIENLYPNHLYDKKARIGIFVKKEAVLKSGDETLVWRVDSSGNFVKKQTVKIVPKVEQGHYRVLKGLKPGDRVLIDSFEDISEGDRIRPIYN